MASNYPSLNTIIERNKGKRADYKLSYYDDDYMFATLYFKESEDKEDIEGDQISFYHNDYATDKIECVFFKKFSGKIETIELKTKHFSANMYNSATKTKLFINNEVYSIWIVSSDGNGDEEIKWKLRKETEKEKHFGYMY